MADDKDRLHSDKDNSEQEYRPSEQEYEPLEEASLTKPSWVRKLLNRRLITIVVLVLAVLIVYQFVGKPQDVKEDINRITAAQPSILPATTTTATETTPPVITQAPVSSLIAGPSEIETVKQQVQQNQVQIQQLQTSVQQLQTSVGQMSNQMTTMAKSVTSMAAQPLSAPVPKVVYTVRRIAPKPPVYTVRAVVPGRAWLEQAKTGATLTVRTGDRVKGYGVITGINSRAGIVSTSSGRVIRFGPNDR